MKARLLIEQDDDLKAELLYKESVASVLHNHGLVDSDSGEHERSGDGPNGKVTVRWQVYSGLSIPTTTGLPVKVGAVEYLDKTNQKRSVGITLTFGNSVRQNAFGSEDEQALAARLNAKFTDLKNCLAAYKSRSKAGLDREIGNLGYRKT